MRNYSIEFTSDPFFHQEYEDYSCHGRITISSFQEEFLSSLSFWSVNDYETHWDAAMTRIVAGKACSCLVTSMYDPSNANFIRWWPLYPTNGAVYVQSQLLFLDSVYGEFDPDNPFVHIPRRRTHTEEGSPISEWVTSIEEIENFLQRKRNR